LKSILFGNRGSISYANLLDPNSFLPSSHVPFHDLDETMSTQRQDNQHRDQEKQARQQRKTVIGKLVIHTLGQPGHLHEVQVRHLWEDHYRVSLLQQISRDSGVVTMVPQGDQVESQVRLRAEAAVLWAEKRFAEAAPKALEGLAVLSQSADPGGALAEGDWLRDILDQCEKHICRSDDREPVH
jgi:hypothetical protein